MTTHKFSVLEGGKPHFTRSTLHYAWMDCLVSKNALDVAVLSEESAEMELEQASLYLLVVPSDSRAREDVERFQAKLSRAQFLRKRAEKVFNDETNEFKVAVFAAAGIPESWQSSSHVHIVENFDSVHVGYGNFCGDDSDPELDDYDGYCILYPTGEMRRERSPKTAPPRTRMNRL